MRNAKYGYQVWDYDNVIVSDGEGSARTLERFAEIVKADIERKIDVDDYDDDYDIDDIEELGWTVWDLETKEYLEFQGSTLVDKGRDEQ
ncbi:hypothetical protein [Shimazuella kribbensis]|uniref:hypothetical protein n=1 Tax=Shimazuella kribbensis TaxID=139808 RepID=UPI000422252B|nr:hypothetical protein [Shimazuella kribbensis]